MPSIIIQLLRSMFLALISLWLLLSEASAEPRYVIALFKYQGAVQGQKADEKFSNFHGILEVKLLNLKKEVVQTWLGRRDASERLDYLNKISIRFKGIDSFSKPEDIYKWMKNESDVLTLLRGSIISDDNVTYKVYSNFYLGDLKEYLPYDVITVSLPIMSSEFANTKDSHTLVFLYALAMDAKRLGSAKDHIALFLKAASNRIADIKRRQGNLSRDLGEIEKAIMKATTELLGTQDVTSSNN